MVPCCPLKFEIGGNIVAAAINEMKSTLTFADVLPGNAWYAGLSFDDGRSIGIVISNGDIVGAGKSKFSP